jgi:hypothetical protein
MTTAPERLIQMVKDIARAFSRRGVQHAVVGGMAVSAHGHPRATKDVDFLIDSRAVSAATSALEELGFSRLPAESGEGFMRFARHPLPQLPELTEWVDLLCASQPMGRSLLQQAAEHPIPWQDGSLAVVSVEGLILMKLIACVDSPARLQDRVDILTLLRGQPCRIDLDWLREATAALGDRYAHELDILLAQAAAPDAPPSGPRGL